MIESITLGQIAEVLAFVVAIGGGVVAIVRAFKNSQKYLTKVIINELEPVKAEIESLNKKIDKVDMESCKNYLVRFLADVEHGNIVDEIERQRFSEQYDHYISHGGNSYIKEKVEKLKKKELL